MPDQQQCIHCGKTIEWSRNNFVWQHANNGFTLCHPFTTEPESKLKATPPPPKLPDIRVFRGTSNDNPNRVTHLVAALNQGYRTACGKATRDAVEEINQTTIKGDVTCERCRQTLKYKQMEDAVTGTWCAQHNMKHLTNTECRNMALMEDEEKSRTSETFKDDRATTDPVQAALMQIHPNLCLAIYGHVGETGMKQYCSKVRNHPFQCGDPTVEELQAKAYELDPDPEPKAPRRSVYCVHCQQWHSPDDDHRVSFDYPPIPYARHLFEARAKDLADMMRDYTSGDMNREDLDRSIHDADISYIQKMHDLYELRLI